MEWMKLAYSSQSLHLVLLNIQRRERVDIKGLEKLGLFSSKKSLHQILLIKHSKAKNLISEEQFTQKNWKKLGLFFPNSHRF